MDASWARECPKVALHEHLDGALRPGTVLENCAEVGHELPAGDADALGEWFAASANAGDLVSYLACFEHTVAAMQTHEHLFRVAREFVLDCAADNVVRAEARWAPEQHTRLGLSEFQAVEAVAAGLDDGMAEAARAGRPVLVTQILTAMRQSAPSTRIAELVLATRGLGVRGFDLAGPEAGFPPGRFAESFASLAREGVGFTIHAGEAAGVDSMAEAMELGARRIGHGVALADDVFGPDDAPRLGPVATAARDAGVVLEVCPSSNLQTGVAATIAEHPLRRLAAAGLVVTVNCDNRLMSATTASRELALVAEAFGWGPDQARAMMSAAAQATFGPREERESVASEIERGFDRIGR